MDEFVQNNKKILKIDNPISLFTNLLSIGSDNVHNFYNDFLTSFCLEDGKMAKFEYLNGYK